MGIISWHNCTTFYFLLIGIISKSVILDGEYSIFLTILYYLVLLWLVYKYSFSYEVPKVPKTNFTVCIIGAGFSGLNMAIKLKQMGVKFRIIEKDSRMGGTWWQNQYPGIGCDVYSHYYSLSYELNPWWSKMYSPGEEIYKYMEGVARKYGILEQIELNTSVEHMTWDPATSQWNINLNTGEEFRANAVVCGVGALNIPKTPDFPGQETFRGRAFHSFDWPKDFDLDGRRVAIIGTGASSVQIAPEIAPKVSHLEVFQRSPAWVAPKSEFSYPRWLQYLFWIYPPLMVLHRNYIFLKAEFTFQTVWHVSGFFAKSARQQLAERVRELVHDQEVAEQLIPNYEVGCKRVTPSNAFLTCFNRKNVSLVTSGIARITETGIETEDGTNHEVDTIVYATGFRPDKSFQTFKAVGTHRKEAQDGKPERPVTLQEEWGDSPNAFQGITYPGYPNMYFLLGPGTGLGHSSAVYMSECAADYALDAIRFVIEKNAKSLDVKAEVNREYQEWVQETMKGKAFNSPNCTSWYRNKAGVNYTLWPSNLPRYWARTRQVDPKDYNVVY